MAEDAVLGPPRLVRRWRHERLAAAASEASVARPIEVLADRLCTAARAWGGPRGFVWLDPGGPMVGPESEGVLSAFPFESRRFSRGDGDLAAFLDGLARRDAPSAAELRFRGGWLGHLSYECVADLEPVVLQARADPNVPLASWALHPTWFRHLPHEGVLELWTRHAGDAEAARDGRPLPSLAAWVHWAEEALRAPYDHTTPMMVFPGHLVNRPLERTPAVERLLETAERSLGPERFEEAVREVQEAIREGEVFQANLAQRIVVESAVDPFHVYLRLRRLNPSPFAGYLEEDWGALVCNSPERLVRVKDDVDERIVEARPIAGTRPRREDAEADEREVAALRSSEKERAEHTMLVDLVRNDLGRVACAGTVRVDAFQVVEAYSHVHHIVSNVRGVLRPHARVSDVVRALFPGGTITGAPKLRSVEVIDRVEPVARGPYTGSLGRIEEDGTLDLNILIRTMVFVGGTVRVHAGAGIVADSDPFSEFEETGHKAGAMLAALAMVADQGAWPGPLEVTK